MDGRTIYYHLKKKFHLTDIHIKGFDISVPLQWCLVWLVWLWMDLGVEEAHVEWCHS